MAETDVLSIRMSSILKARLRSEADKQGVKLAEFVAEACRMRLDDGGSGARQTQPTNFGGSEMDMQVSNPVSPTKPDIQTLRENESLQDRKARALAALESLAGADPERMTQYKDAWVEQNIVEITICGKTWWHEGEQWECVMDKGHIEARFCTHGLRGMVRKLDS